MLWVGAAAIVAVLLMGAYSLGYKHGVEDQRDYSFGKRHR